MLTFKCPRPCLAGTLCSHLMPLSVLLVLLPCCTGHLLGNLDWEELMADLPAIKAVLSLPDSLHQQRIE